MRHLEGGEGLKGGEGSEVKRTDGGVKGGEGLKEWGGKEGWTGEWRERGATRVIETVSWTALVCVC
jgi:hypothetical protein